MSSYCNYYIGYKKEGKIYPLGPYTVDGKLRPAFSRPKTWASNLHELFHYIEDKEVSDKLREEFEFENCWNGEKVFEVKYLTEQDIPKGSHVKTGYFLIEDVKRYENEQYSFEGFFDVLTPEVYAAKLQHEITFGKNQPKKDIEGTDYVEPNASDYMFYAYPDYRSKEYEALILSEALEGMRDFSYDKDVEYVFLETED